MSPKLAAVIVDTLSLGSIYAMVSVGFVVLFRSTKVLSFAQGAFMVVGAFVFRDLIESGWGLIPSLIGGLLVTFVVGALTYRIVFARIIGSEPFITAIATIGLGTFFGAIVIMIWSPEQMTLPANLTSTKPWNVGPFVFNEAYVFGIALAAVVFALLLLGLQRTHLGLRMRAVADDARLAGQLGVRTVRVSMVAWGVAAATAAAGGIAYLLTTAPTPASLQDIGLLIFPAILLGGIDSIVGALVGGMVMAFAQSFTARYWSGELVDVVVFGALLVVLAVRPIGLFGRPSTSRL